MPSSAACAARSEDRLHFAGAVAGLAGVRLVHDHRVASPRDLLAPLRRLCLLLPCGSVHRLGASDGQQAPQHERELLQRRDHDLRSVHQGLCELLGILLDRFDDSLFVLDLVDRLLQLAVKHTPVRDHQHTVIDLAVLGGVQVCQTVREPRDRVRLAAAGGVLDQIVAPGPFLAGRGDEAVDRVELMISRKDQRLALLGVSALVVVDLLVAGLDNR